MSAYESGQAFLQSVLAKLPADKQAAAKALFDDPVAKDAVTLVGDGALARSDYSKNLDALKAKEDELATWFADNEGALKEYVAIKPEYDKLKATPPPDKKDPPAVDPRKAAEDLLAEQGPHFLQAAGWLAAKAVAHERMFGEELDVVGLAADPRLGKPLKGGPEGRVVSLPDLYAEKYGEKVSAKQKEADEKKFNEEVDRRLKERVAQQASNPFPLRGESSVLDVLSEQDGPAKHTIDTAVAEYERLQGARG